jgi:hypothetical protein
VPHVEVTHTPKQFQEYKRGRACGRDEYRNGYPYDPVGGSPDWAQGYCDGFTQAQDEAIARYGRVEAARLYETPGGLAAHQAAQLALPR